LQQEQEQEQEQEEEEDEDAIGESEGGDNEGGPDEDEDDVTVGVLRWAPGKIRPGKKGLKKGTMSSFALTESLKCQCQQEDLPSLSYFTISTPIIDLCAFLHTDI
jgi:hypothetical protein